MRWAWTFDFLALQARTDPPQSSSPYAKARFDCQSGERGRIGDLVIDQPRKYQTTTKPKAKLQSATNAKTPLVMVRPDTSSLTRTLSRSDAIARDRPQAREGCEADSLASCPLQPSYNRRVAHLNEHALCLLSTAGGVEARHAQEATSAAWPTGPKPSGSGGERIPFAALASFGWRCQRFSASASDVWRSAPRYAICTIASTGVRNASSISTATPSPVIASLVSRFMIKPSMGKTGE
jgi:hypothetical protein